MEEDLKQVITYMEVTHPENTFIINKLRFIYEEIKINATQQTTRREVNNAIRWKASVIRAEVQAPDVR